MKIQDNIEIAYTFRDGDGRRKIAASEMRDKGNIGDGDTVRWRRQKKHILGTGDIRYAETTEIMIFRQRLR